MASRKSSCQRASSRMSGDPVALLGHPERAVAQRFAVGSVGPQGAFVQGHQLGYRDPAVDDVLAVVPRVVPAARSVEPVVADSRPAGDVEVPLVGCDVEVSGGSGVLLADELGLDLDAAAVVVVVRQRVGPQLGVERVTDGERLAGLAVDGDRPPLALPLDGVEGEPVDVLTGRRVGAVRFGLPARGAAPVGVAQHPAERLGGVGDDGAALGAVGQVADLVDADRGAGVGLVDRRHGSAAQRHLLQAEGERLVCAAQLDGELGGVVVGAGGEDVLEGDRRSRDGVGGGELLGVGLLGQHHVGPRDRRGARTGRVAQRVALALLQFDAGLPDDGVPRVDGAARDVEAQPALGNDAFGVGGPPPPLGSGGEVAVDDQFGPLLLAGRGPGRRPDGGHRQQSGGERGRGGRAEHHPGPQGRAMRAGPDRGWWRGVRRAALTVHGSFLPAVGVRWCRRGGAGDRTARRDHDMLGSAPMQRGTGPPSRQDSPHRKVWKRSQGLARSICTR